MTLRKRLTPLFSGLVAATLSASIGLACAFHGYVPQDTLVDKMLASDRILLARQDPENPFRYAPVAGLLGDIAEVELPQLVDSVTRRKLAANPDDTVLFVRTDPYGPYELAGYLDRDFRAVVDQVITRLDAWQYGGDQERFQMFADLHDHDNANLRVLALRELDRAPYDLLAALQFDPDADRILDAMVRPTMVEFRPIYILLLGLSGDAAARAPLEQGLAEALALQTSAYIGAWAVALIEHQGMPAVDLLAEQLATNIHLRADTREALVEALTIQTAYGTPEMAARLDAIVADMLQRDPSSAGMIARQLASRGIWTQADRLEAMLKSGALTDLQSVISVSHYLSFARDIEAYEAQNSN